MRLTISQFKTGLDLEEDKLVGELARQLQLPAASISKLEIRRKSLDARKDPSFVYSLAFEVDFSTYELEALLARHANLKPDNTAEERPGSGMDLAVKPTAAAFAKTRPVIVGAGPAGLFAGFRLAAAGWRPIILERGDGLAERVTKVNSFWQAGILDPESNIQYGSGGAGTFSDGKLTTRIKDPRIGALLDVLVRFGAPPEIRYWQYPHIGTDLLRQVIAGIEAFIRERGGEIQFRSCLIGLSYPQDGPIRLTVNGKRELETDRLILATGNSARDVYRLLEQKGFSLKAKPFAVGLRIEHPQELIDRAQYGRWAGHPKLGPAEYHLTYQHRPSGRGVYSFCMCPGGMVIGATSIPGGVVTNGMSFHARASGVANAALIVTVGPKDFGSEVALAGMAYQETLEKRAFALGGGGFHAPAQRVGDFLRRRPSVSFGPLQPSYRPGVKPANLWELFPEELAQALVDGIVQFGRQVKGFDWPDAVLTGLESRTSSPVRIERGEDRQALGFPGVFPVGEGAGYAGGIVSSALDGWKTAETILERSQ